MVDPNRKINRLTDKDIEFLDECEEEFAFRFTNEDEEFVKYCSQPVPDPPVVSNWGDNRSFNRNQHHNGRGGGGGNRQWNNNRHRPDNNYKSGGGGNGSHRRDHNRDHRQRSERNNWNRNR